MTDTTTDCHRHLAIYCDACFCLGPSIPHQKATPTTSSLGPSAPPFIVGSRPQFTHHSSYMLNYSFGRRM
ncbi:hypothetical protein vseg_006210 [Gypsophila vaccaria]